MGFGIRAAVKRLGKRVGDWYRRYPARPLHRAFYNDLIRHTDDFARVEWLGVPIWQGILDLWTIQETISQVKPDLLIETGTFKGGSSLFYAPHPRSFVSWAHHHD